MKKTISALIIPACLLGLLSTLLFTVNCIPMPEQSSPDAHRVQAVPAPPVLTITSRPYLMGFTSWPPSFEIADIQYMYNFIKEHADLIGHQFDNGIPWQEAFDGTDFPSDIKADWTDRKANTPAGHKVFLAIMPFNEMRTGLALNYGKNGNSPLPAPWSTLAFNDAKVKRAFINYAKQALDWFKPDYFCLGLEVNLALEHSSQLWQEYLDFHKQVYTELKALYPTLPIFVSFKYEKLKKASQKSALKELLPYTDILGLSIYPYGEDYGPEKKLGAIPDDFLATALEFNKPVAVTETGAPSKTFTAFKYKFTFTDNFQTDYLSFLLQKAAENRFVFVINWTSLDFDKLVERFPADVKDLGTFWAYTGLVKSDKTSKPALAVWDAYFKLKKE